MHFNAQLTIALAFFTATAWDIEGELASRKAAGARRGHLGIKLSDQFKDAGVGGRRTARVLAQWRLVDGRFIAERPGANLSRGRGVRVEDGVVQMGLSSREIGRLWLRRELLLKSIDEGKVSVW